MYRHLGSAATPFFHPVETWDHPWLDEAGVRWVMTPGRDRRNSGAQDPSWRLAYDGDSARVYERPTAQPEARLLPPGSNPSGKALEIERPSNALVRVRGMGDAAGRLVVSQAWAPGWRARLGEATIETVAHSEFLLAVDLPAGRSTDPQGEWQVDFIYRPPALVAGAWISAAALLWLLLPQARGRHAAASRQVASARTGMPTS